MWPFNRNTETRIASSDPFLGEFLGARWQAKADVQQASGLAVAQAAINAISGALAAAPLETYREDANGDRTVDLKHPLYALLTDEPFPGVGAFAMREWIYRCLLTQGEAFVRIHRNGVARVTGLEPLWKGSVQVEELTSGRIRYQYQPRFGGVQTIMPDDMLHLRYASIDGVHGRSPIQLAAASFGLAVSQANQAGAQSENAFRPAGALVIPEKIGGENKRAAIVNLKERFVGSVKAGDFMVLDGGAKFETFQFSARDSEFLESRKLSNLDICSAYGIPPSIVGILDGGGYGTSSEEGRRFLRLCLRPWARRIENQMAVQLLSPEARKTVYLEHDLSGVEQASEKERYEAYSIGRNNGWLSINDIRHRENMPRIAGGNEYLKPMNMQAADAPAKGNETGGPSGAAGEITRLDKS